MVHAFGQTNDAANETLGRLSVAITQSIEDARRTLAEQNFSTLLGTKLEAYEEGRATLGLVVGPELSQQYGVVHGGVLSYLADNCLAFAGGSVLEPLVFSSEFKINYLRPASGNFLQAEAEVIHAGRRQAIARCEVFDWDGVEKTLCVAAQGTIVSSPRPA